MANFWQWKSKHPENKLLYYICGVEQTLSLEVLDAVVRQFQAERIDLDVVQHGFAAIENAVLVQPQRLRVIVIRNIDRLCDDHKDWLWARACDVLSGNLSLTVLVVYTTEDNPDTSQLLYRPFVSKGRFVECKAMSVDSMKRYAQADYSCTEAAADLLAEMVSYNFRLFNNELEKLSLLNLSEITESHIRELVVFSAEDLLVDSLLSRNQTKAQQVVTAVSKDMVGRVLNQLAKKLSFLHLLIGADAPGTNAHKLAGILGVQPWQLLEYFAIKKYWTQHLILDKLRLLISVESNYTQFQTDILPLLAHWW